MFFFHHQVDQLFLFNIHHLPIHTVVTIVSIVPTTETPSLVEECESKQNGSEKDSIASSRHRELHKTLEKNRRAHLRSCFEELKKELPKNEVGEKKTSHIQHHSYGYQIYHQLETQ